MEDGVGEGTEVATADFTWVLYVPGGEVRLASTPLPLSDRGDRGRRTQEGEGTEGEEEEPCPTAAFINMRTCSLRR